MQQASTPVTCWRPQRSIRLRTTPIHSARALTTIVEAARRAASVGALREAVGLFERAAEIEPDERRRAEYLVEGAGWAEHYGESSRSSGRLREGSSTAGGRRRYA